VHLPVVVDEGAIAFGAAHQHHRQDAPDDDHEGQQRQIQFSAKKPFSSESLMVEMGEVLGGATPGG
jgi:hypothetical protein